MVMVTGSGAEAGVPGTSLPACASSVPQGQACVVVQVVGGPSDVAPEYFSSQKVQEQGFADVTSRSYDVPSSTGAKVDNGTSVGKLISQTLMDRGVAGRVSFVEVDGPDGYGRHLLDNAESGQTGADSKPPVIYGTSNNPNLISFVRAQRSGDDDQGAPGPDYGFFDSDAGGSLSIVVHLSGRPLNPSITATAVDGSGNRSFALSCSDCTGQKTWVFPDGTTSNDASPTFTFGSGDDAGSYPIALAVQDPDGSFGGDQTYVQVGSAPTPSPSASQTGSGGSGSGHHGSTHGGNGHSANPHPSTGSGGSATSSATATATARPSSQASVPPVQATTLPSSSLFVPPTDGPLTTPARPSRAPTPTPTSTPTPTPTPSATASGPTVSGVLLSDARAVAAPSGEAEPSDVPTPTSAAAPALEPDSGVDPLFWLGGAAALLLGAGAASESDWVDRLLRRGRGRWARIGA